MLFDRIPDRVSVPLPASGAVEPTEEECAQEARLVARLRDGEEEAFRELLERHRGRLLALARRYLGEADAQDVLQDALVSVLGAIGDFRGTARLSTWLHRVVINTCLMKIRARRRRPETTMDPVPLARLAGARYGKRGSLAAGSGEAHASDRELCDAVAEGLRTLPASYRTVLLLRAVREMDTGASARALGVSANAVKIRLHRARRALRKRVSARLGGAFP